MKVLSVCSGIGAPECAWAPLGFDFVAQSEIEPFPSRVLAHRFPGVPNVGDMTRIADGSVEVPAFDLLVGGTPCQSFSVAGLRGGLADARGNLALSFCQIAARYRPEWVVWENVPGVLSSDDGQAFGSILGALVELGYGLAWRVLDAQNFGVPQRRRRVFLVGHSSGSVERARAVLFESEGVRRDPAPRGFAGEGATGGAAVGVGGRREPAAFVDIYNGAIDGGVSASVTTSGGPPGTGPSVLAFDTTQITSPGNRSACAPGAPSPTLAKGAHPPAIAFHHTQDPISGVVVPSLGVGADGMGVYVPEWPARIAPTLNAAFGSKQGLEDQHALHGAGLFVPALFNAEGSDGATLTKQNVSTINNQSPLVVGTLHTGVGGMNSIEDCNGGIIRPAAGRVRRVTPLECERLQGFPDGWTDIPGASDSARYRALGNSMAVPVLEWIGRGLLGDT